MILNFNNSPCLVIRQISLGPEDHFLCLKNNQEIILAIQPSGIIVLYDSFYYDGLHSMYTKKGNKPEDWHREVGPAIFNETEDYIKYYANGKLHRLDGPAFFECAYYQNDKKYLIEYWIDGNYIRESNYEKEVIKYKKKNNIP